MIIVGDLRNLRRATGEVFGRASYAVLAVALTILAFLLAVWLPNIGLIADIFISSHAPLSRKLTIALSLLGSIFTNFTLFSAGYTIAIAMLFGANVTMIVYFLKRTRRRLQGQEIAAGTLGVASGALGIGCAACGSFLLSTVLSAVGAAGALAILPLHGGEFGILGVVLLVFSLVIIAKKIASPLICTPPQTP
ncbi:MAG: hypothetical protein Q8R39_01830 [bacterium]|nr:hypothetical protein [bacterium]MDZ4284745.1 hypothetical protein [Patescibacteria group bacterium]